MVLSSERLDIIQRKLEQTNEGIMHVLRESSSALDDSSTTKKCHTLDDDDENTKKKSMDEKLSEGDSPSSLQNKSDTIASSSDTGEFFATKNIRGVFVKRSVCVSVCVYTHMHVLIYHNYRIVAKGGSYARVYVL